LIILLVFLFRGPGWLWRARGGWNDKRESPREILDRRYASGEITKEQYEEMRRTLER
jgi:putative membrane protein